jgi:shikimate dehydrogenase
MRLFGLIGYPLSQSFSKKYFDQKFKDENLGDCKFENFSISSIHELDQILATHPQTLQGLAVTIPYKRSVLRYLDSASNIPEELGACNCIRILNGQLIGYNTDYLGFEKSLLPLLQPHHKKALILGNGGAAAAVKFVLSRSGIDFIIASRSLHHDSDLTYKEITPLIIRDHLLIINTTPVGMYPQIHEFPDIPYDAISEFHLLYDLIYNPEKTIFLQKGETQGATIKNGAEMLVLQAEENWRIWNSE